MSSRCVEVDEHEMENCFKIVPVSIQNHFVDLLRFFCPVELKMKYRTVQETRVHELVLCVSPCAQCLSLCVQCRCVCVQCLSLLHDGSLSFVILSLLFLLSHVLLSVRARVLSRGVQVLCVFASYA